MGFIALSKDNKVVVLASFSGREEELRALGCKLIETKFDRHGKNPLQEMKLISLYKKYIREKYPYTRFHVCGNCEQAYENILRELNDNGTIIYHGRINDISGMHSVSQCTIHPTYYPEGMSNVLLESCACGRPIITTNRSGCREIVDDGVNGFIVNMKDSSDLIEKVERFLSPSSDERKNMGLAGRSKVEKEFDRNIVIDKYMNEIERLDQSGL